MTTREGLRKLARIVGAMQDQANELRDLMGFFKLERATRLGSGANRGNGEARLPQSPESRKAPRPAKSSQDVLTRPNPEDPSEWEQF